jgi:NADP-dependent 3-hydroxy acid dehydrogenase YdfG
MNQLDFANRCAVITGGAAGIGYAVAQRLALSGATVSLWDRDREALSRAESSLGRGTLTQVVDVGDAQAVERVARDAVAALGKIDVLVCSAGIAGPNFVTWEYPLDAWSSTAIARWCR